MKKPPSREQRQFGRIDPRHQLQVKVQQAYALHQQGRLAEALAMYQEILKLYPKHFNSLHLSGVIAIQLGKHEQGIRLIDQAITISPDVAAAYNNRGNALLELGRFDEALANYDRAVSLQPEYAEAYYNRGNALKELQRLEEAVSSYDKAVSLKSDHAEAYNNRGNALLDLYRLSDALSSYDRAIACKTSYADAHNNRGNALRKLWRMDEALRSYDKALSLKSDYADAHLNRGHTLLEMKRPEEAVVSYEKALKLKPDFDFLFGTYLYAKMRICNWDAFADNLRQLAAGISQFRRIALPFPTNALLDCPEIQAKAAKIYAEAKYPINAALGPFKKRERGERIRVGYYSADFRNHPMSYLMADLFEDHNAEKFELYGFSFGPDTNDDMRKRVSVAFDKFIDVRDKSDRDVAKLSRDLEIDIAVDLMGYTENSRPGIFAARCSPLQVSYLGYAGTLSVEYIDYVIADKIVVPPEARPHFTEKIVYLPYTYQANAKRKIADRVFTKQELGLPEQGFVFCCFNNNYKIIPETFEGWMRLIKNQKRRR